MVTADANVKDIQDAYHVYYITKIRLHIFAEKNHSARKTLRKYSENHTQTHTQNDEADDVLQKHFNEMPSLSDYYENLFQYLDAYIRRSAIKETYLT